MKTPHTKARNLLPSPVVSDHESPVMLLYYPKLRLAVRVPVTCMFSYHVRGRMLVYFALLLGLCGVNKGCVCGLGTTRRGANITLLYSE